MLRALDRPGNLAFSPMSIRMAFAMLRCGAAGETEKELARVLHFDFDASRMQRDYVALVEQMAARNTKRRRNGDDLPVAYEFAVGNGLFVAKNFPLIDDYVNRVRSAFGAQVAPLDFRARPEESRAAVNAWVRRTTAGKITELLRADSIDSSTKLVLVNAMRFRSDWAHQFDPEATTRMAFHAADGDVDVPFMRATDHCGYFEDDVVRAVSLRFESSRAAMTIFLPKAPDGLPALESTIDGPWLHAAFDRLRSQGKRVVLAIPKFTTGSELDLLPALRELGLDKSLGSVADYHRISEVPLEVNWATHQATIEIDEHGAEAAAATAIGLLVGSAADVDRVEFTADRPFLFAIHELQSGQVLFFGRLAVPRVR
jgi:serpin B